jgi:hypothetical protein
MLQAIPKRWFSWDFTVLQGSTRLADIDMSLWREKGALTVQGKTYQVYREGLVSGAFVLESPESVVARATKPSAFRRAFLIEHAGKQYTLRAKSAFRRGFVLLADDREIGSLSPQELCTRRAAIVLPEDLSLPVKVFIIWLAVILWKREAEAGAAGGAT